MLNVCFCFTIFFPPNTQKHTHEQVVMTLVSIPLMDRTGRRTLHLYGLGGMFIFSIFITISFLIKASVLVLDMIKRLMYKGRGGRVGAIAQLFQSLRLVSMG